jgi:hypothetical protein
MNTSYETISDRGASRTSPLQSAAEMQQEAHQPAVSSFSNQVQVVQSRLSPQDLNEMIRKSSFSGFAIVQNQAEGFIRKGLDLLSRKNRMGLVVQHGAETGLLVTKAAWKYLRGFNEALAGEAMIADFIERAVLQREFTVVEFYEC